jgi:hypothetical protein
MTKILPVIFVLALFSCSRTRQSENQKADSSSTVANAGNDYELASINRTLDSDSLLASKDVVMKFSEFLKKGTKFKENEYGGGDCYGKFKQIDLGVATLTIDKYDCGDYGFGNTEFITDGDSLRYVRQFKIEWSPGDKGNEFKVSETIYEFSTRGISKKTRAKSIEEWKDFRINDGKFEESSNSGQSEYNELKKELRDLALKEKLDE